MFETHMDLQEEKETVFVRGGLQVDESQWKADHLGFLHRRPMLTELVLVRVIVNFIDPEQ